MFRTIFAVLVGLVMATAGVVFLGWLLWWLWTHREEEMEAVSIEIEAGPSPPAPKLPAAEPEDEAKPAAAEEGVADEPVEPDDLRRVEGIGPKIAGILQDAGIETFDQLASTEPSRLEQILGDADPRLARLTNPASWPEQAALAAAGEWEALEALQGGLKAGRRK